MATKPQLVRIDARKGPPARMPTHPPGEKPKGLQLVPIQWGKRDPDLARGLCWHIGDATPAIVIPFNPFTHRRLRAFLRSCGIV